jgi:hypothetical protein
METEEQRAGADVAGRQGPEEHSKLSDVLRTIAGDEARERISVGDILAAARDRAFGALILIFAFPNVFPTPPGTSWILGTVLVFLAAQLMVGRSTPWLPRFVSGRSLAREDFAALMRRVVPWVMRAERLLRPRLSFLVLPPAEQALGLAILLLAVIVWLPIPLGNIVPAVAISVLSLAILERDGAVALVGLAIGALSVGVIWAAVVGMVKAVLFFLQSGFGF